MTLQQLRYFVEIVEKGSISKAADSLYVSQPSLTASIKSLETSLGITLFSRTNRGVILTDEGEDLLGHARQIIAQVNQVESNYINSQEIRRDFSVSIQHLNFAVRAFTDVMKKSDTHTYRFNLIETVTQEVIDNVSAMRSQVGVLNVTDFNRRNLEQIFIRNDLEFTELATVRSRVYVSQSHPLAGRQSVTVDDLMDYPAVIYDQGINNALYFSESATRFVNHPKQIHVRDRGTAYQIMEDFDAFASDAGVNQEYTETTHTALLLEPVEIFHVGYIVKKNIILGKMASDYLETLHELCENYVR